MMMASTGSEAYLYYFTFHPSGEDLGAYHAAEIVYALNNVHLVAADAPENHLKLADAMSDYWVHFAKHGKPDPEGLPKWLPYTREARHYMDFGNEVTPNKGLLPGVWEFHEKARKMGLNAR